MMTLQLSPRVMALATLLSAAAAAAAPAAAQNRQEQQMLAEMRILQEQVQRLVQVVNTLGEQLKTTTATTNKRLDDQATTARSNYADLKQQVDAVVSSFGTLRAKADDNNQRVSLLAQESAAIRRNLDIVTQLLQQTLAEIQTPAPTTPASGGGSGSGGAGSGTPPLQTVPSPANYFNQAFGFYTVGQYDLAIESFKDFVKQFPNSPDAAKAQFYIGESYYGDNPAKYREAVAAYDLVISNPAYVDSEWVPQAYYKQGVCYEALKQPALARKNYEKIRKDFKDSTMAIMAAEGLKRVGGGH